jgi:hypothetical protein
VERPPTQQSFKKQSDRSPGDPVDVTEGLHRDASSVSRGKLSKHSRIIQFASNMLFIISPVLFLTYAVLAAVNNGKRSDIYPVPQLHSAAKYGPEMLRQPNARELQHGSSEHSDVEGGEKNRDGVDEDDKTGMPASCVVRTAG